MDGITPLSVLDNYLWMDGLSSWVFTGKFKFIKALEH